MILGVDYYPEQWPQALLEEDLARICELGANTVRIGEFAWDIMEPQEGSYDFSYFDQVIERAARHGLRVLFGTPTATCPAWLANRYPEVLSMDRAGHTRMYGGRRQYCFNSTVYQEKSHAIVCALAQHYKGNEHIIGWQIDNEFGHEGSDECFCPNCARAFREWLAYRHGSIESLNEAWGTIFWSQRYGCFEEISPPGPTIAAHNPAHRMDWERFRSHSVEQYCAMQYDILKAAAPDAVILHDFSGGCFEKHFDFHAIAQHMDVVAYNNYPVWGGQPQPLEPAQIAFGLDAMRGLKRSGFWVTEAIMGAQGHDVIGYLPRPGQAAMWAMQALAHGCEALLFFRYRGAAKGAEQFCFGILDADNRKRRRFFETKAFIADAQRHAQVFSTPVTAHVALLCSYAAQSSFFIQRQSDAMHYKDELVRLYEPFYRLNQAVDVIDASEDFTGYKILLVPAMVVMDDALRQRLRTFAGAGGTVVLTFRTAWKDTANNLPFGELAPVGLTDFAGVHVEESESLQQGQQVAVEGKNSGTGKVFREMLAAGSAQTLMRYTDMFYRDYSAVTQNRYGKGHVYYLGTALDAASLGHMAEDILAACGIRPTITPPGVELAVRGEGNEACEILINHNSHEASYNGHAIPAYGYIIIAKREVP